MEKYGQGLNPKTIIIQCFLEKDLVRLIFVWYGKDGQGSVDNAGKYVYAVSNNGHFEDGDNYIIGRVLKTKLAD